MSSRNLEKLMPDTNDLSERELEILRLVATGASNKEIAQQLYISPNTVKVHLKNIFAKIGAASRTEAAMFVVQQGLYQPVGPEVPASEISVSDIAEPAPVEHRKMTRRGVYAGWGAAVVLLIIALFGLRGIYIRTSASPALASPPAATNIPRWSEHAALPSPRFGLAVAVYGDILYAIAGEGSEGITGAVEQYEPALDRWSTRAVKPLPVSDVSAAVLGGKIYIPGGRMASGAVSDRLEIYDPLRDAWSQGARLPAAVSAYALAAFEGKLYLFGGWDGKQFVNSVYEYNPDKDSWVKLTSMPTSRGFAGAVVSGRTIYVIGGFDGKHALDVNQAYLPDQDNAQGDPWQDKAPLPAGRYAMGTASIGDYVVLVGGEGEKVADLAALVYLPLEDEWQQMETPAKEIGSHLGLVSTNMNVVSVGGKVAGAPTGQNMFYRAFYSISIPIIGK